MKYLLLVVFAFILTNCASKPWKKFSIDANPDKTCWTGSEAGYEVYVWDCHNSEHIVVYQWQASLYSFPSKMEKVSCGEKTKFEKEFSIEQYPKGVCKKKAAPWRTKGGQDGQETGS